MKNKILTHKVTRDEWINGRYFQTSEHSIITNAINGYKVAGAIYSKEGKEVYKCFVIVTNESLFTVLGRKQ